jgi:signal transduction histidine kinase
LALVLAFIFQPIKRFFNKVTNKFFYKDDYNTDDFFARLNKTMTITTDLRDLLERASHEISSTLKSEQAFFFIYTNAEHYVSAGTAKHKQLPKRDAIELGGCKDTHDGLIVAALLDSSDPIHRLMLSHEIEIVLPLRQNGQSLGYLCLGNQKNSGYTIRDMKVLSTIADELVIAIQNALSVQEVKDLNENLQQRIDLATKELRASNAQLQRLDKAKDEFVSMASHQLRTPLTSIKGYISMILDGDVGKVNDNMKQMLDEAFMSSERMVHLINDFLSMSRIQTGRFMIEKTESDLSKVVKQEIDSLQSSAIAHGLRFNYEKPTNFPLVKIDEGKIRQVIMNFADNAIYYSKNNTEIDIALKADAKSITFTVKDYGIGVPVGEQANLFTKFYRATNARTQRPDGTGVGLYLAKRIVDAHKGKIVFESIEGKGSTFGFSIPIKQD